MYFFCCVISQQCCFFPTIEIAVSLLGPLREELISLSFSEFRSLALSINPSWTYNIFWTILWRPIKEESYWFYIFPEICALKKSSNRISVFNNQGRRRVTPVGSHISYPRLSNDTWGRSFTPCPQGDSCSNKWPSLYPFFGGGALK